MELAFDLCTLALYDIAIYADDSTSMKFAEGMVSTCHCTHLACAGKRTNYSYYYGLNTG